SRVLRFLVRRPATPTLFPYPTLFRSPDQRHLASKAARAPPPGTQARQRPHREQAVGPTGGQPDSLGQADAAAPLGPVGEALGQADRKSTRLNSSHVKISYAVFCLKKK